MAAPPPRRTFLGGVSGPTSFSRVYRTADAIEVDEIEGTDVARRRVLLEEVLLVTHHREYGTVFVVTTAAFLAVFGAIGAAATLGDRTTGLILLGVTALPALVALALRLALGLDVVTVYGRRTRASLRFWLRKSRGREVFRLVCRLARERQERLRIAGPGASSRM